VLLAVPVVASVHGDTSQEKPAGPVIREETPWDIAGDVKAVSQPLRSQ